MGLRKNRQSGLVLFTIAILLYIIEVYRYVKVDIVFSLLIFLEYDLEPSTSAAAAGSPSSGGSSGGGWTDTPGVCECPVSELRI